MNDFIIANNPYVIFQFFFFDLLDILRILFLDGCEKGIKDFKTKARYGCNIMTYFTLLTQISE